MERVPELSRRQFLIGAGATLSLAAVGCTPQEPANPLTVAGYFPTYTQPQLLKDLARRFDLSGTFDYAHIAFALPNEDGEVEPPILGPDYTDMLGQLGKDTELVLSIGGWSVPDEEGGREKMASNLRTAFTDPERFSQSAVEAHAYIARLLGRDPQRLGLDIDLEQPEEYEADAMTAIMASCRSLLPENRLVMAVPSGDRPGFRLEDLAEYVSTFNVMTYDYATYEPGTPGRSGYIAPQSEVVADVDQAVERIGDAAQIAVGFPAYGWRFPGTDGPDQAYRAEGDGRAQQSLLKDVPPEAIGEDGSAVIEGAWTSFVTADMVRATLRAIRGRHPQLGGSFVWSAESMPAGYAQALRDA